jgi:hypothetical protein
VWKDENNIEQSISQEHDPIGRGLEIYIAASEARQTERPKRDAAKASTEGQRAANRRFGRK